MSAHRIVAALALALSLSLVAGIVFTLFHVERRLKELQSGQYRIMLQMEQEQRCQRYDISELQRGE